MQRYSISLYHDTRRAKANGKYPVKIRVYASQTQEQRFYPAYVDLSEDEFKSIWLSTKPRKINHEARIRLQSIEQKANEVAEKLDPFSFDLFEKNLFRNVGDSTKIQTHYQNKIEELQAQNQISTASNYRLSEKSLKEFSEQVKNKLFKDLIFYDITPKWLEEYEYDMIERKKRSTTTVSMYLRALRTIFNRAIDENEVDKKFYPFGKRKYQVPASKKVKKALTKEELKIFFNAVPKTVYEEKAKDFWFFSYACNGINIKDVALLQYKQVDRDMVVFYRSKIKRTSKRNLKPITVYLNEYSTKIIEKYGIPGKKPDDYVFGIIEETDSSEEQRRKIQNFTRFINQHVSKICKDNDLPNDVSTYWARHTFATNSIRNGASMELVSESLGHNNLNTTKEYFAGFDSETKKKFAQSIMNFE